MPKSPDIPDDDEGEPTIVQRLDGPPGAPVAPVAPDARRAPVTQQILFAQNVDANLAALRQYRVSGNFEDGAAYGDELYEFVLANFADDPESSERELILMQIIDEAGWMHYARKAEGTAVEVQKWSDRASELYSVLAGKRKVIEQSHGSDFELRRRLVVGEMKTKLWEVRLKWQLGQFFEHDDEQSATCTDALWHSDLILNHDRSIREFDDHAGEIQRRMVEILNEDPEYGATVAEAKRMNAMMSGLSYIWNHEYQMSDHDVAEKTLPEDSAYAALLAKSERLINDYIRFYIDHPFLPQPPEFRYAYLERIRHLKLLGRHDESIKLAMRIKRQTEGQSDELYKSRVSNRVGEGQIVLAQKMLSADPRRPLYHELVKQARAIDAESDNPAPSDTNPSLLAFKFLQQGRAVCSEAMNVSDFHTARVARNSALDGALTLLSMPIGAYGGIVSSAEKRRILENALASFSAIERKFDDDVWLFYEAPALAALCMHAAELGIEVDIAREIPREHFEASHRALAMEYRKDKLKVPRPYYDQIAEKIKVLRGFLQGF